MRKKSETYIDTGKVRLLASPHSTGSFPVLPSLPPLCPKYEGQVDKLMREPANMFFIVMLICVNIFVTCCA